MDCKKIGLFIQNKRKAVNLTQSELGVLLGVSSKAVSKWECGVSLPDINLINDLADILKVSVSEILNGEEYKFSSEYKRKRNKKFILFICISLLFMYAFFLTHYLIITYNGTNIYNLTSDINSFSVNGHLIKMGGTNYLSISDVVYIGDKEEFLYICDLAYEVIYDGKSIYKVGKIESSIEDECIVSDIKSFLDKINFFIELDKNYKFGRFEYFVLKLKFLDERKEIKIFDINIKIM